MTLQSVTPESPPGFIQGAIHVACAHSPVPGSPTPDVGSCFAYAAEPIPRTPAAFLIRGCGRIHLVSQPPTPALRSSSAEWMSAARRVPGGFSPGFAPGCGTLRTTRSEASPRSIPGCGRRRLAPCASGSPQVMRNGQGGAGYFEHNEARRLGAMAGSDRWLASSAISDTPARTKHNRWAPDTFYG